MDSGGVLRVKTSTKLIRQFVFPIVFLRHHEIIIYNQYSTEIEMLKQQVVLWFKVNRIK